jgi:hypothetical protein
MTADPILAFRAELRQAASRRISSRRRRRLVALAVLAIAVIATGLSIAANGWLSGEPAPAPVVQDFQAYTPQLGFHPEPGKAVLVAEDGVVKLYATTNREGTYCIVVDEPWRPAGPKTGDGGVCVSKAKATEPISAGWLGSSPTAPNGMTTYVIAGRVEDPKAKTLRFSDRSGATVERPIGVGGFYVAAVPGKPIEFVEIHRPGGVYCPGKDWEPTFVALGDDGTELVESRILIIDFDHRCLAGGETTPHGPYRTP